MAEGSTGPYDLRFEDSGGESPEQGLLRIFGLKPDTGSLARLLWASTVGIHQGLAFVSTDFSSEWLLCQHPLNYHQTRST